MKICAAAKNLDTHANFGRSGRYNQPIQYGRDAAHKNRVAWAGLPLGSTCLRGSTSTRISTRALQPDQEEVSSHQEEIPPSPNSKQTPNFSAGILARGGDFKAREGPIVCLYFYQEPIFCGPAYIFMMRQDFRHKPIFEASARIFMRCHVLSYAYIFTRSLYFVGPPKFSWCAKISGISQYLKHPPEFSWDATISGIRQYFRHPLEFSRDAKISGIRQYFHRTPIFYVFAIILSRR